MSILIYILLRDKKKNLLTLFHTEKHFKIRKEHVLLKRLLNKVPSYLLCLITLKVLTESKKHLFVDVLQSSCY